MGNGLKAQLFKTSKGFYLQELPKKGAGGAQCEMTIGSTWGEGDKLSLENCKSIENGYDLDELALQSFHITEIKQCHNNNFFEREEKFKQGFQKALELLGDKKFTEDDIYRAFEEGERQDRTGLYDIIRPTEQTEWDVEMELQEVITDVALDIPGFVYKNYFKPRLDKDGCLILKRI